MAEDSRSSGRPVGDVLDIASGDGSLNTALTLRDEETVAVSEVKVEYSPAGTTDTVLTVYDEPDGIQAGNETEVVEKFHLSPGDRVNPDMVWPDIEDDVIVTTDGNQDAEVTLTIGGYTVTG